MIENFNQSKVTREISFSWSWFILIVLLVYTFASPLWRCAKHLEKVHMVIKEAAMINFGPGPQDE